MKLQEKEIMSDNKTEDDQATIYEMFMEFSSISLLNKGEGVWKLGKPDVERH